MRRVCCLRRAPEKRKKFQKRGLTREQYKALGDLESLNSVDVSMPKQSMFNARQLTASK